MELDFCGGNEERQTESRRQLGHEGNPWQDGLPVRRDVRAHTDVGGAAGANAVWGRSRGQALMLGRAVISALLSDASERNRAKMWEQLNGFLPRHLHCFPSDGL